MNFCLSSSINFKASFHHSHIPLYHLLIELQPVVMILFWNNTYYMGLSYGNNTDDMFDPPQSYYFVINYIVGLVFMASFFIGVGLNPFVIMFNWEKRQSSVSLLFCITAGRNLDRMCDLCFSGSLCKIKSRSRSLI